jgi:hypothetical protein
MKFNLIPARGPFKRPVDPGVNLVIKGSGSWDTAKFHNGLSDRRVSDLLDYDDYVDQVAAEAQVRARDRIAFQEEVAAEFCAYIMIVHHIKPWEPFPNQSGAPEISGDQG